jgi:excisionase family DNA binding protein
MKTISPVDPLAEDEFSRRGDAELVADGLLTVAAAATYLSCSRSKVYQLMDEGELRFVKLGRARRVPRRALIQLAAQYLQGGWRRAG